MTAHADTGIVSAARLVVKRTRARAGLVGAIAATVAVSVALLCGMIAWIALDTRIAVQDAIPGPDSVGGWVQVQTRPASDAKAQDAAAHALFAQLFGDAAAVTRLTVGEPGTDAERIAWRISPDRAHLDGAAVLRLDQGVAALPAAFRQSAAAVQGSDTAGTLGATLRAAAQGVRASAAIAPVPVAIAGILAWFAVLELGLLLGAARGRDAGLLRARGLSSRQSAVMSLVEAVAVVAVGAVAGLAGAVLAFVALPGGAIAALSAWPLALGVAALLAATLGIAQSRAARAASSARSRAGRVVRAASTGVAALLVLGAGVLGWQSVALRSLPSDDPWRVTISALAPTFGVAAVGILSVLLFAPLSAVVARAAQAAGGISPSYPARQVSRRLVAFSVAIALVAIASCSAVLSASYVATWRTASTDSARLAAGTALRADFGSRSVTPAEVQAAASVDGVAVAAPALVAPILAGELSARLVALPVDALPTVMLSVPGAASPNALTAALTSAPVGFALPGDAESLRLSGVSTAQPWKDLFGRPISAIPDAGADLASRAWVADAAGTVIGVDLAVSTSGAGESRTFTAEGPLPPGVAPWRVLGIEISRTRDQRFQDQQVRVGQLTLAAVIHGTPTPLDLPLAGLTLTGWGFRQPSTGMVWTASGANPAIVRAVVTTAFADALGLTPGKVSGIRFEGTGRSVTISVADVVDAIPGIGTGPGVLAPLDALSAAPLITVPSADPPLTPPLAGQIWASGPAAAAGPMADALGVPTATPVDAAAAVTGGLVVAWWACAVGGALLAGVALVALLTALTGQRAGEVLVLRAAGVSPRRQAGMRGVEASVVVALAALLGLASGWVLSALAVPGLAEAAVPGAEVAAALVVDPGVLVAALGVVLLALVAVVAAGAAAIRQQSASTRLEEAAP